MQRFVRTEVLDKVYAAVGQVFANADVTGLKLEAFKCYYIPDTGTWPLTPFALKTVPGDNPEILPALITYLSNFVPKHSGANYEPHVTAG